VLSACHPLYSATHRIVVYGRLAKVVLPGGRSFRLDGRRASLAAAARRARS